MDTHWSPPSQLSELAVCFSFQKNSYIFHHICSKTWWTRECRGGSQSVSFGVTLSKTLSPSNFILYFSINRRDWKRWSLGLLLALTFYNSICWFSNKILQGRNCKSVYLHKTMKLSLGPWIPWSGWTKHICLAARKRMAGHQSWKGHGFLCVFQSLFFKASKINKGSQGHFWVCDRYEEGSAYRTQSPTLISSKALLSTSISFTFWIWNNLLFEVHKYKALTTEAAGFHPLYSSI